MSFIKKIGKKVTKVLKKVVDPLGIVDALDLSGDKAKAYNSSEAQKERDWQEELSNTAHQREVADLESAGLNPILSVNSGATSGAGASASAEAPTGAQNMSAILGTIASLKNAITSAQGVKTQTKLNDQTIADLQNQIQNRDLTTAKHIDEMNATITKLQAETQKHLEEAKARARQNKANEDLGLADNDTGITRQVARSKYNAIEKTKDKTDRNAREMATEMKKRSIEAQKSFNRKVIAKLDRQEIMEYTSNSTSQHRKVQLIKLAKQRGAFN